MVSGIESVDVSSVTSEIDNIFGEIEQMLADYQPSNIEIKDSVGTEKIDVAATRDSILKAA